MPPDGLVDGDVLIGNFAGAALCCFAPAPHADGCARAAIISSSAHFRLIAVGRVAKSSGIGAFQSFVGGIRAQSQPDAIGRDRPDQRRAAHLHRFDGAGRIFELASRTVA